MIPQAGSAYSYATLGELVAWIIGWDLILECRGQCVAISWGDYFTTLVRGAGLGVPAWLDRLPHGAARHRMSTRCSTPRRVSQACPFWSTCPRSAS